jgi:hypothetical protein
MFDFHGKLASIILDVKILSIVLIVIVDLRRRLPS